MFGSRKIPLPVPVYHSIGNIKEESQILRGDIHNIRPDVFYDQIISLMKHYTFVTIDELVENFANRPRKNKRLLSITFDDGYKNVIVNALPVLNNLNIPSTLFYTAKFSKAELFWRDKVRYLINRSMIPSFIEFGKKRNPRFNELNESNFYGYSKSPGFLSGIDFEMIMNDYFIINSLPLFDEEGIYCSIEELKKIENSNFTIGNHTWSHYLLTNLSKSDQYDQIKRCQDILTSEFKNVSNVFCIPFGGKNAYNEDTIELIDELNYSGFLTVDSRDNCYYTKKSKSRPLEISRFLPTEEDFIYDE